MRYRLVAEVEGTIVTENSSIQHGGLTYEMVTDDGGNLTHIAVERTVEPSEFAATVGPPTELGTSATLKIEADPGVRGTLVEALQALESALAFASAGALQRIRWDIPQEERIPESPDEGKYTAIHAISLKREYLPLRSQLPALDIERFVHKMDNYSSLVVPKAFWREGMNEFRQFRYVQAFYNFYFILEDFYAGGRSGMGEVLKSFSKSRDFARVTKTSYESVIAYEKHRLNLETMRSDEGCNSDIQGIHKLLFKVRGRLHHYTRGGRAIRVSPFTQDEFESIALLAMMMANLAIGYEEVAISRGVMT